ncbi:MAG: peptidoglycan DD-metalloendopeptidase family protein [Deltaproteobacteria bacterium]|nr:peptidoglycan DD-metalloendopeptidase family protein [Deltaproteobacteria bacterium]
MLKAIVPFVTAFVFLASGQPVAAAQSRETIRKEKRLEDVTRKIREEKKAIGAATEREVSILDALDDINKGIAAKRQALETARKAKAELDGKSRETASAIAALEDEKKVLAGRLSRRVRAMYKIRKGTALAAVFTADTMGELGRRHKYLTLIMDSDASLIDGYERNLNGLDAEKARLASLGVQMNAAAAEALTKKAEAESLKKKKTALLAGVKNEKRRRLKVVKELTEAAAELTDLIARLRTGETQAAGLDGFASMKGRLDMPVAGMVSSRYGKVRNQKYNTEVFNNGIIIESELGVPVKNVYPGKVAYVGWLRGYGQVMIIDHGGGYYTLFAQLSRILKDKGAEAAVGETVALVGDSGPTGLPGLYFEIRQKGVPRDPEAWFVARAK